MKVSVEWVNEFLTRKLSAREMADAMELAAIEVEQIEESQAYDQRIVIGMVLEVSAHPNADKLKLAKTDVGNQVLNVVCGAPNVAAGQLVPVATVGAILPDGTTITKSKIRGEISEGMLCSEQELGISQNHEGIMMLTDGKPGQMLDELFTTKPIIDVKTAANRWDLTSIRGIAREVAAQTGQSMKLESSELDFGTGDNRPKVNQLLPEELVSMYMLAPVKVDPSRKSPKWMQERLMASNIRPISVVVDITNYILMEFGQPLHAFDASRVIGEVDVRLAQPGEELTTLDGVKRKLDPADIVISDSKGALGLAGVMGGADSEVTNATTAILLESASFSAGLIRKTAARHGLRSEASARFERGVPAYPHEAMAKALLLLSRHASGKLNGTIAVFHNLARPSVHTNLIGVDSRRIGRLLGMSISDSDVKSHLEKLDFIVDLQAGTGSLTVTVPWWRPDVTQEADIAEEVIKMIGYDKLPSTLPIWRPENVQFDRFWPTLWQTKAALRSLDLFEISTYSFISQKQIAELGWDTKDFYELENPMSSEQAYLRENLLPSLLSTANKNRAYGKQYGMFEISKGFTMSKKRELPKEQLTLGVLVIKPTGAYKWVKAALDRLSSELSVNTRVEPCIYDKVIGHPTRSGFVFANDIQLGLIGQLHPDLVRRHKLQGEVAYLEVRFDLLTANAKPLEYRRRSAFPTIERDLAVKIDREVTWQQVKQALEGQNVKFVNDYYGDDLPAGTKSLAVRFKVELFDRTPTDSDADTQEKQILKLLNTKFKATPR